MHFFYIIYSKKIDQYYSGETEDIPIRLGQHNSGYFKSASTSKANDWKICLTIECKDRSHARRFESFVKKQKSRKFIESLINDPEKAYVILKKMTI